MLPGLFGPALRALLARASAVVEHRSDAHLLRCFHQAGRSDLTPERYRLRQLVQAGLWAGMGGFAAAVTLRRPLMVLVAAAAGFLFGAARVRRGLERDIEARAARLRLELYTADQLLAMHVRTGAGVMQSVQRLVARGHGEIVRDLDDVLTWARSGVGEAEAFRRAAELSPEPAASRTYRLLAAGAERGVDLAGGLLALAEDLRDTRREELHRRAVRRRAAMLVPTIAILAPIMLLFIAAPLPSIVLGHR